MCNFSNAGWRSPRSSLAPLSTQACYAVERTGGGGRWRLIAPASRDWFGCSLWTTEKTNKVAGKVDQLYQPHDRAAAHLLGVLRRRAAAGDQRAVDRIGGHARRGEPLSGPNHAQIVEATTGIEPVYAVLQTAPWTTRARRHSFVSAGCPARIRTSVHGSKVRCPTTRRRGNTSSHASRSAESAPSPA